MPLPKDCIIYKCGLCEAHDLFLSCISMKCLINSNHFDPLDSGMAANITFHVTGCICMHLGLHGEASSTMWMHSTEENSKGSSSFASFKFHMWLIISSIVLVCCSFTLHGFAWCLHLGFCLIMLWLCVISTSGAGWIRVIGFHMYCVVLDGKQLILILTEHYSWSFENRQTEDFH